MWKPRCSTYHSASFWGLGEEIAVCSRPWNISHDCSVPSPYIELHARSAFSFLRGSCLPEDYASICAEHGIGAMAISDADGFYGSPRFHGAAKKHGIKAHVGAEITVPDGSRYTLLAASRTGYRNLSRLDRKS